MAYRSLALFDSSRPHWWQFWKRRKMLMYVDLQEAQPVEGDEVVFTVKFVSP